ncbi:MAG: hypothetical protein IPK79_00605 [Vampirovibrionales bacterium]|nr:hypothetical protein [Vampirovibrionales bacterium]
MESVLKANREQLLAAVKLAIRFHQKSFGPLDGMLLIEGGDRGVTVSGINPGERRIDATIGCEPLADTWPEGVFVSGKLLSEILGLLPSPMVRIGWNDKTMAVEGYGIDGRSDATTLKVRQDNATRALLKSAPDDEAPYFLIGAAEFGALAGLATTARSGDESRPTLTGVRIELMPDDDNDTARLAFVCTDGYRLVKATTRVPYAGDGKRPINLLAPGVEMTHMAGQRGVGDLKFVLFENKIEVSGLLAGDIAFRLVTHLSDGNYPNYAAIIPNVAGEVMEVDLREFRRHLATAKSFKRDDLRVDFEFGADAVQLRCKDDEKGDFESRCPITRLGTTEPVSMAMNMAYLESAVTGLLDLGIDDPTMHYHADNRPFVLKGEKDHMSAVVVVMPMIIPK